MNIFDTIILGIVEGVTEFLPISSTAHLEITQYFLRIPSTDFVKSFQIAIQLGAILAVIILYKGKLFSSWVYCRNVFIAFIPTAVIGFVLYTFIKSFLLGNLLIAGCALLLGGLVILFYEHHQKDKIEVQQEKTIENLTKTELLTIGSAQALAVVPGVSRSGAVIISGRMLGLPKSLITEFSFLLAIPTMCAAVLYDLLRSGFNFSSSEWGSMALGFIVSFLVALLVVKWLIQYIQAHSFAIFGWYRIILGLALIYLHIF